MILVGQMDSPFVRRVAVSMNIYGMAFEREVLSVYGNADAVRKINPLGKVPALVLDGSETLFDSQMIIDHLDETAGPDKALTPSGGPERRSVLACIAVALGISEKVVGLNFETKQRPPETIDDGVIARLEQQVTSGLEWLERRLSEGAGAWLSGDTMTQADVTAVCTLTHLIKRRPELFADGAYPALASLQARAEALPVFQASPFAEE
ncbi:MAG: glutathione S-transferase family protein [Rhodospirillales bacterium]|nr:glutathione S-transferase family protein [Alphaproteobacteria bacterium]MBL6947463.1 glutathione S-transferase family protein [Rhodospirillales bacterium]